MPAKAKLTTRERTSSNVSSDNLNKGSELSHAEADSNFINLRDQTIAITDGSTSTDIQAGESITFSGASVSGNTVTVPTGDGMTVVGDDSSGTLINGGETLKIAGGTNITTAMSGDTLTITGASGSTGDLTIATSEINSQDTVSLSVPNGHDLELNAGTGGGPGGTDRFIQVKDRINFHGTLNSDGSNGDIHLTPNGNGKIAFHTGATAGYTFPVADANAGGKVMVLSAHDGSNVKTLGFASVDSLITTSTFTGDITFNGSTMISPSNADITLDPSGSGEINLNATTRFNTNYKEDIQALSSATSIAVDCSLASVFTVTLAHDATFTFNNLPTGGSVSVIIRQDGTGSRLGTYTNVLFPGNQHTLSTGAADIDIVSVFSDGTSLLGNISKDYS